MVKVTVTLKKTVELEYSVELDVPDGMSEYDVTNKAWNQVIKDVPDKDWTSRCVKSSASVFPTFITSWEPS